MKSYDYFAAVYDSEVYCAECLPDGVSVDNADVDPIFADSEWDYYPVCCQCACQHNYVCLTTHGQNQQALRDAIRANDDREYDGLVVADTADVPSDYDGEVLHVNDHGNATLYSAVNGELTEIASCV